MHFGTKSYLKSNRYYTAKQRLPSFDIDINTPMECNN
jgi:hypothetical protein